MMGKVSVLENLHSHELQTLSLPRLKQQLQELQDSELSTFDTLWLSHFEDNGQDATITVFHDIGVNLGYAPGEIARTFSRKFWLELIHKDDREVLRHAAWRSFQTGEDFLLMFRVACKDGKFCWWENHGTLAGYVDGSPLLWVGAIRDVTARVASDEEHRNMVERLRQVTAQASGGCHPEISSALDGAEHEIVGQSFSLKQVLRKIPQVAPTNSTVLITGETGTGKELIARAIHRRSRRSEKPLVALNCAALPAPLVESELFGHEKGAFTGAFNRHIGRFELAHNGTIFLDEVEDLQPEAQAKLLRVLQTGEFQRVGSSETKRVNVRVIAASNRNLQECVERGTFRRDLFYRLNVFPIHLTPLRERKEDIPLLAAYLVQKKGPELGRTIRTLPEESIDRLKQYDWPGNIRELENVIERALILSSGPVFDLDGLTQSLESDSGSKGSPAPPPMETQSGTLEEIERAHIVRVCQSSNWRIKGPGGAAEILGLPPSSLYFRMNKLGIARPAMRH